MEAGHRGRTGPPATYAAVAACRNVLARAPIRPLSTGEPSARACRCRRAPATHCVQVSTRKFTSTLKSVLASHTLPFVIWLLGCVQGDAEILRFGRIESNAFMKYTVKKKERCIIFFWRSLPIWFLSRSYMRRLISAHEIWSCNQQAIILALHEDGKYGRETACLAQSKGIKISLPTLWLNSVSNFSPHPSLSSAPLLLQNRITRGGGWNPSPLIGTRPSCLTSCRLWRLCKQTWSDISNMLPSGVFLASIKSSNKDSTASLPGQ